MSLRDILNNATPGDWVMREEGLAGVWDVVLQDGSYAAMSVTEGDARLIALAPELAALVLDMGEFLRHLHYGNEAKVDSARALFARLDQLGAK